MIKPILTAILLANAIFPQSVQAEAIISPQNFESLSVGKTLYFYRNGTFFGAEQFLENRKSLWQFQQGTSQCLDGTWFARGDLICFTYVQDPRIQCWHFLRTETGYSVRGEGSPPEFDIDLDHIDEAPLDCAGPGFGA